MTSSTMRIRLPAMRAASAVSKYRSLLFGGGNGVDGHVKYAGHVQLGSLPGQHVFLVSVLPGHLVDQGDALGLGGDEVVIGGGLF